VYLEELRSKCINYIPLETYINNKSKLLHQCSCEEKFTWQVSPSEVLRGSGCPKCASHGFSPEKPAKLYFFSFEHDNMTYYKVGITNRTTEERHKEDWNRLKIMVMWEIEFEKGADARATEKQIISENKDYLVNTRALLSGNTETFSAFIPKPRC
jgi:hypothetical protein